MTLSPEGSELTLIAQTPNVSFGRLRLSIVTVLERGIALDIAVEDLKGLSKIMLSVVRKKDKRIFCARTTLNVDIANNRPEFVGLHGKLLVDIVGICALQCEGTEVEPFSVDINPYDFPSFARALPKDEVATIVIAPNSKLPIVVLPDMDRVLFLTMPFSLEQCNLLRS